jgi:hypothetical protein
LIGHLLLAGNWFPNGAKQDMRSFPMLQYVLDSRGNIKYYKNNETGKPTSTSVLTYNEKYNWSRHHVDKPDGITDKEFEMNKRRRAFLLYSSVQKVLRDLGVTVENGFPRDMIDELLIHPVYISWNIHSWVARDRADSWQPTKIQQMVMDCLSLQPSKTQSGKDCKTRKSATPPHFGKSSATSDQTEVKTAAEAAGWSMPV